jgi:hypothetical protein
MLIGICKYCKQYKQIENGYGNCKSKKFVNDIVGLEPTGFNKDSLIYSNEFGVTTAFYVRDHFGCIHYDEIL